MKESTVMKQNRIVDTLVVKIQKKKRNHNKNQPER
jgi:hypothetical protein